MISLIEVFKVDELYSNDEIFRSLGVSNAGGVRLCLGEDSTVRRIVVFTSEASPRIQRENPYHDRIEGKILVYTGAGKEGDQNLTGVNRRLPLQVEERFPIYLFSIIASRRNNNVGPKRWRFLGLIEFLRHYQETQFDIRGTTRSVWLFEFLIHDQLTSVPVLLDSSISREIFLSTDANENPSQDDRQVELLNSDDQPNTKRSNLFEVSTIRARLLSLTPENFEHLVKDVLLKTGFERVQVTKYSQDGGVDVNAYLIRVFGH